MGQIPKKEIIMIKILAIGNSFSQDAIRYLYGIARTDGVELKVVNLFIGGCSLAKHYRNMLSEERAYDLELNGMKSGFKISMREALLSDDWDYVTIQQQSSNSAIYDTFVPYLTELAAYVRKMAPKAKILLHQTWGYKKDSERLHKFGYTAHEEMFTLVRASYEQAEKLIKADGMIPSGEAVLQANLAKAENIYRDDFHMSPGFGRYMLGLVWYRYLTGRTVTENSFSDFDKELSAQEIELAKQIAEKIV